MSEDQITIAVKNEKSNAPLICGIIGFVLEIPNLCCNILCAAAAGSAKGIGAGVTSARTNEFDYAAANTASKETMDSAMPVIMIGFFLSLLCFIFCFFGKKKAAMWLGVITILASLYILVTSICFFSFFGLAAGILFLIQGIMMILNSKKC